MSKPVNDSSEPSRSISNTGARAGGASKLRFKKMSEVIADALRGRIARGEIGNGDVVPNEKVMQEEFGVSRPTLREAMRILEAEGLLVTPRGGSKGAQIVEPSSSQAAKYAGLVLQVRGTTLADIFALRTLVAPGAARILAEMPRSPDLGELRTLLDQAHRSVNLRERTIIWNAFDRRILELTGNEALNLVGQMISHLLAMHLHSIPDSLDGVSGERLAMIGRMQVQFNAVLDAIESGEADVAESLMRVRMKERASFQSARGQERLTVVG